MVILSDSPKSSLNIGGSGLGPETEWEHMEVPERYSMDVPFHLLLMTFRESQDASSIALLQASPNGMLYLFDQASDRMFSLLNRRKLHSHDFYELLYVIDGEIYQNIEHNRHYYPAGSCCLMSPNVYHTEESYGNQRIAFLGLRKDFLETLIDSARFFEQEETTAIQNLTAFVHPENQGSVFAGKASMDFIPLESPAWVRTHIHDVMDRILRLIQNPENGSSLQASAMLLKMLCLLFDPEHYRHSPVHFASDHEEKLFREITLALETSHGRMSRADLETRFHYSGDYLYKIVRKFTGLSLSEYGTKICLKEAVESLETNAAPVSDLIRRLGFTNQTHFYQLFRKEYGMSPREYQKAAAGKRNSP